MTILPVFCSLLEVPYLAEKTQLVAITFAKPCQ